jgi:acetylornithine deacetylase/succinyl-diaminopimelate desuccinylase-like protein
VREGDLLYGRGTADDGYALFAAVTSLLAAGGGRGRVVILIEASEESGSPDLSAYVEHLRDRIGTPSLVICLDSGCLSYDRLWLTSSLRGNLVASVRVDVLTEGVHSGVGGRRGAVVVPHPAPHLCRVSRTRPRARYSCPSSGERDPRRTAASLSAAAQEFADSALPDRRRAPLCSARPPAIGSSPGPGRPRSR